MLGSEPSLAASCTTNINQNRSESYSPYPFAALTFLFFMWGFMTALNDILIPHLKSVFSLNYTQAMLVQFCFFGAYFLVSLPAGALVKRIGYKNSIVVGLITSGIGCLLFYPAASTYQYALFLGALFVLASGITTLQVAANPYVALLGRPESASSRLTLSQAFNAAGTTVAPLFGSLLILSVAAVGAADLVSMDTHQLADFRRTEAAAVQGPYLLLATIFFVLGGLFALLKLPPVGQAPELDTTVHSGSSASPSIWSQRHLMLGAVGIFLYVGAEVSIGSFLISFLGEETIAGMQEAEAAKYLAYYWGGAMIGRFIGAVVMRYVSAGKVLAFNALGVTCLLLIAILGSGAVAMWSILLVGLLNSIMFPTIFSLGVNRLGPMSSQGSAILCLAIVGGAIVPLLQGVLADAVGIQLAFLLPLLCYLYIAFYGFSGSKVSRD